MNELNPIGGCLCNEVSYRVRGALSPALACHCGQCRSWGGHHLVAASADPASVEIEGEVRWYASSSDVRRGFCPECGSSLFWQRGGGPLHIMVGTLDAPSGTQLAGHVFVKDKGDYYEIDDNLPKSDDDEIDLGDRA
ncbi:GFA family protein [Profundibacterium mesophilum]|uniref:CENP-V/GFA domain-containing protein n=1 Tax=Profundibacterium mesophilum KAUST100406-0324 TaxID=1037889 RepID=A0A921NV93_9RHOB|nr:GFA family protein [Profundibacterium mesophilum]KAF0676248.1 hypothetical protein PMES_01405 [Profundibacterium mesophilum KAUST100406-0324]